MLGLPDVDLAIISDSEKMCLLLELKWFIDPAEAREIIEKSEEIEKGISQVLQLKQAFGNNHEPLIEKNSKLIPVIVLKGLLSRKTG